MPGAMGQCIVNSVLQFRRASFKTTGTVFGMLLHLLLSFVAQKHRPGNGLSNQQMSGYPDIKAWHFSHKINEKLQNRVRIFNN